MGGASESFQVEEDIRTGVGGDAPQLHEDRSSWAWDPPRHHPVHLFIWLFTCIIYHIL